MLHTLGLVNHTHKGKGAEAPFSFNQLIFGRNPNHHLHLKQEYLLLEQIALQLLSREERTQRLLHQYQQQLHQQRHQHLEHGLDEFTIHRTT